MIAKTAYVCLDVSVCVGLCVCNKHFYSWLLLSIDPQLLDAVISIRGLDYSQMCQLRHRYTRNSLCQRR